MSTPWSDQEILLCIVSYKQMLKWDEVGTKYSKAENNRKLQGKLKNRSRGSIEFRMRNLSYFFSSNGLPILKGYMPASHVGKGMMERLVKIYSDYSIEHNKE